MKKYIVGIAISVVLILVLAIGVIFSLTVDKTQMWVMKYGIQKLSEQLQTRIKADSIGVNIQKGRIFIYGFEMDDRQQVCMLKVDTVEAGMSFSEIFHKRIIVDHIILNGAKIVAYKENPDSAANYQFLIDTFKKEKIKQQHHSSPKGFKVGIDLKGVYLHRIQLTWNKNDFTIDRLKYNAKKKQLKGKGIVIKTNNGKPRKNKGKPHRGAFDAGHLNTTIDLDVSILEIGKDKTSLKINHLTAKDKLNGFDIKEIRTNMDIIGKTINLKSVNIDLGESTNIAIDSISGTYNVNHSNKEDGTKKKFELSFTPTRVNAKVVLKDIAKAFAPTLEHFTTPLALSVTVGGNMERIYFKDIIIHSSDNRLHLTANGDLCKVLEKQKLCLHFNKIRLDARNGIKEQIVNHFAKQIKLKMMEQMRTIGNIRFNGSLGIFYKLEHINGTLLTQFGNIELDFNISGVTKYLTGTMKCDSLEIGQIMDMPNLGAVRAKASYSFDTASKRKRFANVSSHRRLPIGIMKADIDKIRYKMIHLNKISADIKSDGTTAKGLILLPHKLFDIATIFEYTQTDTGNKISVKPSITRHKKNGLTLEEKEKLDAEKKKKRKTLKLFQHSRSSTSKHI